MSEGKTGYKYSIKFNQSLTSGTLGFEGYYAFDEYDSFNPHILLEMLKEQEKVFTEAGYKVASIVPNNLKQLANKPKEDKKV